MIVDGRHRRRLPVASTRTDEDLLGSDEPEDFGVFYDRHIRALLGYFARRTGDPEVAADLAAETFASALVARRRFRPGGAPASAWLYTIAQRRLADFHRKGRVDDRLRRSLAMERRPLGDEDAHVIRMLADDTATTLLAGLPDEQRDAVARTSSRAAATTRSRSSSASRRPPSVSVCRAGSGPSGGGWEARRER
jgi:RNA polymerase sigma-70 factor, ECF subfamily